MFDEIFLSDLADDYLNKDGNSIGKISGLSKVNIFIGANNSGKSRFMRLIMKIKKKEIMYKSNSDNISNIVDIFKTVMEEYSTIFERYKQQIANGHIGGIPITRESNLSEMIPTYIVGDSTETLQNIIKITQSLDKIYVGGRYGGNPAVSIIRDRNDYLNRNSELKEKVGEILEYTINPITYSKIYFPILRSLTTFQKYTQDKQDIFFNRVEQIYELKNNKEDINIFTGQNLYNGVRSMLLGDREHRDKIRQFEKFLSEYFFENKDVVLIPKENGDDVLDVNIGGEERRIYDLGDGIQSLIILTFPLFTEDHGIFFLEEPELNLHPGMQRKLLEVMLHKFTNHQYFLTTHSNHFLDLTIENKDISIYKFDGIKKENYINNRSFLIRQVVEGDISVLDSLGVRNSSVFLANSTIWVEGITDRLYFKKYLDLYIRDRDDLENLIEDIDYSFVEYGGNNITHRSFLSDYTTDPTINVDALCARGFLIADNDNGKVLDRKDVLLATLGDAINEDGGRFYQLGCNEVENLLTLDVVKNIVNFYEGGSAERRTPANESNFKAEFKTKKIGFFIQDKLFKTNYTIKRPGKYKTESGTIKDKLGFCRKALDNIHTFDDLSEEAKELTNKIYSFILSNKT